MDTDNLESLSTPRRCEHIHYDMLDEPCICFSEDKFEDLKCTIEDTDPEVFVIWVGHKRNVLETRLICAEVQIRLNERSLRLETN